MREFVIAGIFKIGNDICVFTGPVVLNLVIAFLANGNTPTYYGLIYVVVMFAGQVFQQICVHQYFFRGFKVGMQVL